MSVTSLDSSKLHHSGCYTLAPWNSHHGCIKSSAYWISFFVIGLITGFIPALIYQIVGCGTSISSEECFQDDFDENDFIGKPFTSKRFSHRPQRESSLVIKILDSDSLRPAVIRDSSSDEELLFSPHKTIIKSVKHLRQKQEELNKSPWMPFHERPYNSESERVASFASFLRHNKMYDTKVLIEFLTSSSGCFIDGKPLPALDLYGCSHIEITPEITPNILFHDRFENLNFIGCKILDRKDLIGYLLKLNLKSLHFDFEQPISSQVLNSLCKHCPNLTKLTIAVLSEQQAPFEAPTHLRQLSLHISHLSQEILENILNNNPHLKELTLIAKNQVGTLNIREIINKYKPDSLKTFNIIFDTKDAPIKNVNLTVNNLHISLTQIDTDSLFNNSFNPNLINFRDNAFAVNIRHHAYDTNKLHMLLKIISSSPCSTARLTQTGKILAEEVKITDIEDLMTVFEPFMHDLDPENSALFNLNLELLLRSAISYCMEKSSEPDDLFAQKGHAFAHLIKKHEDTFLTSMTLLKSRSVS